MPPLILLLAAAGMPPRTATVCPGTGDYDTIQDAIDGVMAGTTITVCPGTYDEDLTIRKALTLRAAGGGAKGQRLPDRQVLVVGPRAHGDRGACHDAVDRVLDGVVVTRAGTHGGCARGH